MDGKQSAPSEVPQSGSTSNISEFSINDRVLVYWCQGLYRAKVLDSYLYENRWWRYYICYLEKDPQNWKGKKAKDTEFTKSGDKETGEEAYDDWDEFSELDDRKQWIGVKRLLKATPENLEIMKDKAASLRRPSRKELRWLVNPEPAEDKDEDSMLKKKRELDEKLGVNMSPELFMTWIEDEEISLHLGMIVKNPPMTVHQIMENFMVYLEDNFYEDSQEAKENLRDQSQDLEAIFNSRLPALLYRTERRRTPRRPLVDPSQRWRSVDHLLMNDQPLRGVPQPGHPQPRLASETYGAEHLLRMIAKLEASECPLFFNVIERLLKYLDENEYDIFTRWEPTVQENPLAIVVYEGHGDEPANDGNDVVPENLQMLATAATAAAVNQDEGNLQMLAALASNPLAIVVYEGHGDEPANDGNDVVPENLQMLATLAAIEGNEGVEAAAAAALNQDEGNLQMLAALAALEGNEGVETGAAQNDENLH